MQINIIFENMHVVAVSKPAACLSVPSRMGAADPRPCLGKLVEKSLTCRLWPVHRLDFEVSGVILFAKTAEAHRIANRWFEDHHVRKTYEAWTEVSDLLPDLNQTQTWESILAKGKKRAFEAPHGKPAMTIATLVAATTRGETKIAIWHLHPLTGRSHQLRYELYKRKLPIIGDMLYGSGITLADNTIALRSIALDFTACDNKDALSLPDRIADSPMGNLI